MNQSAILCNPCRVPKRTNERQQIIELLKEMLVGPTCKVTPSKLLRDTVTSAEREVDVVAEYDVEGDVFVQSIEVTSTARPADVTWVEQMLRKHQNLPTDRLFLVSWGGFTSSARTLAETNAGVVLVTPEAVAGAAMTLYADRLQLVPRKSVFVVQPPTSDKLRVVAEDDLALYSADRTFLGWAVGLVHKLLNQQPVMERVGRATHDHPERDDLHWFEVGIALQGVEIYLHQEDVDELHKVVEVDVSGDIAFAQQPLEMEIRGFMEHRFAHGKAKLEDATSLIVATLGPDLEIKKLIAKIAAQ